MSRYLHTDDQDNFEFTRAEFNPHFKDAKERPRWCLKDSRACGHIESCEKRARRARREGRWTTQTITF